MNINGFSVRGDVGEPGVTGFVKGHLGLFGAVCFMRQTCMSPVRTELNQMYCPQGGIFRSVIQTFGQWSGGFSSPPSAGDGIDVIVAVSFGAIGKLFAVGAPTVEVAGSHRCY